MKRHEEDYYVWRTMEDEKVRESHALRDGKVYNWNLPPVGGNPGEDYNCRCWAEEFDFKKMKDADLEGIMEENEKITFDDIYYSKYGENGQKIYEGIADKEGGFSNRKNDAGGATNYGIIQKSLDEYHMWKSPLKTGYNFPKNVSSLTQDQAKTIMYEMYYLRYGIHKINNLRIARNVFDEQINQGNWATKDIVSAINDIKKTDYVGKDIISDKIADTINQLTKEEEDNINDLLSRKRMERYFNNVDKNPININNLRGWYNRIRTFYSNPQSFENLYQSQIDYYIKIKYAPYYNGK